jgi:hypothetical protein
MATRTKKSQSKTLTTLLNLSPEEISSLPKPREGFTNHAETLFTLYAEHVDELSIKGQTPQNAMAELEAFQTLLEMERDAQKQLARIQETRALRAGNVWSTMLDVYARAQSAGRKDVEMMRAISDFTHFMKHKSKKSASVVTAPITTAPAAVS